MSNIFVFSLLKKITTDIQHLSTPNFSNIFFFVFTVDVLLDRKLVVLLFKDHKTVKVEMLGEQSQN